MFPRALRFARIGGIELKLDPTLLLFALLVVWTFTTRFGATHPTTVAVTMAVLGMVGFFASVLAHELGHALEARHRGMHVEGITLFLFGGVTEMHAHGQTPRDELAVAAVGPFVSLVCGALFGLVATFASALPGGLAGPVGEVAGLLGWLNVVLAAFNLIPGAPLDGGRVLRAGLWWVLGDRARAVRIAGRCGQVLALTLLAGGIWAWAVLPGALITALLSILLAAFLYHAARTEIRDSHLEELYSNRTVGELLGRLPDRLAADLPIDTTDVRARANGADLVPVTDADRVVGVLPVDGAADLHPVEASVRTVGDLVEPIDELPTVDVDDDLHTLVDRFQGRHAIVRLTRGGEVLGAVTEREVARAIDVLRGRRPPGRTDRPDGHTPADDPGPEQGVGSR
jgi:Zn-dependent protease